MVWTKRMPLTTAWSSAWKKRKKTSRQKCRLVLSTPKIPLGSDEQAHVRFTSEFKEGRGAAEFEAIDELAVIEPEQLDRHLAGDHFHIRLAAQIAQTGDARHAVVLDGLFHEHGGERLEARHPR